MEDKKKKIFEILSWVSLILTIVNGIKDLFF